MSDNPGPHPERFESCPAVMSTHFHRPWELQAEVGVPVQHQIGLSEIQFEVSHFRQQFSPKCVFSFALKHLHTEVTDSAAVCMPGQ